MTTATLAPARACSMHSLSSQRVSAGKMTISTSPSVPALHALFEGEQGVEQGIVLGEGGADVELVGGGAGRREPGDGSDGA